MGGKVALARYRNTSISVPGPDGLAQTVAMVKLEVLLLPGQFYPGDGSLAVNFDREGSQRDGLGHGHKRQCLRHPRLHVK